MQFLHTLKGENGAPDVVYRPAGNNYMLVEYGELVLDLNLRFRIHALDAMGSKAKYCRDYRPDTGYSFATNPLRFDQTRSN